MDNVELIQQARELCDAAKSEKERGNALDSAAMSWAITNNCVPQLCDALEAAEKEIEQLNIVLQNERKEHAKEYKRLRSTYLQEAATLTARAEKAEAENRWIPVSERLPKKPPDYFKDGHWWMVGGEDFIVVDSDGKVYEAHWTYGCSCQNYFWYVNSLTPLTNITHWRPLPEPPKGE
jgi:hypothetical protein